MQATKPNTIPEKSVTELVTQEVRAEAQASVTQSIPANAAPADDVAGKATLPPSVFIEDLTITGQVRSLGNIHVKGNVKGDIAGAGIVIGEKAIVDGVILADMIEIRGRMKGVVYSNKVKLHSGSWFEGDIHHSSLSVDDGAHFVGQSLQSDDPKAMATKRSESSRTEAVAERETEDARVKRRQAAA
ncbi:MAG: polymer-forming cytoskeletal protein [Hyphomicrobiales bacterium]|nr:polymer-forming cytoskeletal protein [Hyphomicrobiales bacterium]